MLAFCISKKQFIWKSSTCDIATSNKLAQYEQNLCYDCDNNYLHVVLPKSDEAKLEKLLSRFDNEITVSKINNLSKNFDVIDLYKVFNINKYSEIFQYLQCIVKWNKLSNIGNLKIINSVYFIIFFVPIIDVVHLAGTWHKISYFAALSIAISHLLFGYSAPKIFKDHVNVYDFINHLKFGGQGTKFQQ